jgi:tRNA (guanine-N7-)-methyltransferase
MIAAVAANIKPDTVLPRYAEDIIPLHSPSRKPSSNQSGLHPQLAATVRRHLAQPPRKPVAAHTAAAFDCLLGRLAANPRAVILDSFCGTGHSTALLAERHPDRLVVGVDKSAHRLQRHPDSPPENCLLLRADCTDFWQLLVRERIAVSHHYLLYPNPWPKRAHLQRRVHGGDSFHWLLRLADGNGRCRVELRSNWQLYVEEFGAAMLLAGIPGRVGRVTAETPLSRFERKYRDSGHELWAYTASIAGFAEPGSHPLAPAHRDEQPDLG